MKQKVLFVCIHNSARSQMAEELMCKLAGDRFEVASAGIEPGNLNPVVIEVLKKEEGIDISDKKTCAVKDLIEKEEQFDYVVTVCDEASAEACPTFPGNHERIHWGFTDPSSFDGSFEEKYEKTVEVKNEIKAQLEQWLKQQ